MKTVLLLVCASALAVTATATPFCTATSATWCEHPDAPPFVNNAEWTIGTGALNNIIGNIGNGTLGSDVYAIDIANPSAFTATFTPYAAAGISGETQAALYLYNSQGEGVEAADDGTSLSSFNAAGGIYYLGITPDGNAPQYSANGMYFDVFQPFVAGQVSLPAVGSGSLDHYSGQGCGANCTGGYDISLTGSNFAATPEPASMALTGSAITLFALLLRRYRRS